MYGLPLSTEITKQLPKTAIYRKYNLSAKDQLLIDNEISRLDIVNEISPRTTAIDAGSSVQSFFVIKVQLKSQNYNKEAVLQLFSLIGQKCIFALSVNGIVCFACKYINLFTTSWVLEKDAQLKLSGINMDSVWDNILADIIGVDNVENTGLKFQVERKIKLDSIHIELEKLIKNEKKEIQPRKSFEIHSKVVELRNKIKEMESNPLLG